MSPDSFEEGDSSASPGGWVISEHKGSWVPGFSAGGSRRYNSTLAAVDEVQLERSLLKLSDIFSVRILLEEPTVPAGAQRAGPGRRGGQ